MCSSVTCRTNQENKSIASPTETSTLETLADFNTERIAKTWQYLTREDRIKISMINMSVAGVGMLLNSLVIIAIIVDPLKILRQGPWVTILNLTIVDLVSCISFFWRWSAEFYKSEQPELFHAIVDAGWIFGASASFLFLAFLSVQIFMVTKYPIRRRYFFTTLKIVIICIALWVTACLLGFSNIVWLLYPRNTSLKIYAVQICFLELAVVVQVVLNIKITAEVIRSRRTAGISQSKKRRNIAITVVILTLIFCLTAFPYFVLKQIEFLARLGYIGQDNTADLLHDVAYCYAPIAILNFTANPILYSLRLPHYRKTFLSFVFIEK